MSTPLEQIWTLHREGLSGGPDGEMLEGCHIIDNGITLQFTEPDVKSVTASSLTLAAPFTFPIFKYRDRYWAITVWKKEKEDVSGSWSTPGATVTSTGTQNGDFTAQTGGGMDTGKAASHARA